MMTDYTVSPENQARMDTLHSLPGVQKALEFLENDQENSIRQQITLAEIESPSYHEGERAAYYAAQLRELGVQDVVIREDGNVTGVIPGTEDGQVLMEAHLDTVFPFGTVKGIRREQGILYGPGIYDNARGIAALLAMLRALRVSGLRPRKSVIIAGSVQEENTGFGIRQLLDSYPDLDASVSVDGGFIQGISYNGTFSETVSYTFHGIGGHAGNGFGLYANALTAACRFITKLSSVSLPIKDTTYAATRLRTPDFCSLGSIPSEATATVNFRSTEQAEFERLKREIDGFAQDACREETEFWGRDEITVVRERLSGMPGGKQDIHSPLVEAHYLAGASLGLEPFFRPGGSSNNNYTIFRGIPGVTAGAGSGNRKGHSVNEFFPEQDAYRFPQGLLLLLLMAAGVDGSIRSVLD